MSLPAPLLALLGADDAALAELARRAADGRAPGRVVRSERTACLVATGPGEVTASPPPGAAVPTVGDWVLLAGTVVDDVLPRRSTVVRADASGRSTGQVLAANVDALLVCTPLTADARLSRLERLLALAWSSGAAPVVVATKADACPDPETAFARLAGAAPGVDVLATSVVDGAGLDAVRELAGPGRTLAVLGASGVGKSSLANALFGRDDALAVAEIRSDGKGRHTTAWRELVVLPGGGAFIDTPGLRAVGLHDSDDGVRQVFAEIEALAAACRFADCGHESEPGCAVLAAVDAGEVEPGRVARHRKLRRELAWQEAKTDARLRAERSKAWKAVARAQRARGGRP